MLHDQPGMYCLGTHVSVHPIPVYVHPELLEALSPTLRKRMQSKSCFNFKAHEPELIAGQCADCSSARISPRTARPSR